MKVYKKSIWTNAVWWLCISQFLLPISFIISGNVDNVWIILTFLYATSISVIFGLVCNYLIFANDYFIVKNAVYPFIKNKLYYSDIRRIEFRCTRGIFLQIYLRHSDEIKRLVLECVKDKHLLEIADLLKKKGIEVDDHIIA